MASTVALSLTPSTRLVLSILLCLPRPCCRGVVAARRPQNRKSTAESFSGAFRKELEATPSRRVLHEGSLVKISNGGKGRHEKYMVRRRAAVMIVVGYRCRRH